MKVMVTKSFRFDKKVMEIWKDIKGYEGYYQVSNLGRVKSLNTRLKYRYGYRTRKGRILKPSISHKGYFKITLSKNNKSRNATIHRTVAQAFIPNPENKPCTNHKNGIKTDNRVENLEWCTISENTQHAYDTGLKVTSEKLKEINRIRVSKRVINIRSGKCYRSLKEASEDTGITYDILRYNLRDNAKNKTDLQWMDSK